MTESPIFNLFPGEPAPHSSVLSDELTTPKIKHSEDTVGPFTRWEIDRGIPSDMKDEFRTPILQVFIDKLREKGSISVMDAGCGTGRALYQMREQLLFRTDAKESDVLTTGVSNIDFSDESESAGVRNAISKGDINYVVDDLSGVQLPSSSLDAIYSFEAFIYNEPEKIIKIVQNLLPSLKPDGFLIFNLKEGQRNNDLISTYLENGKHNGFSMHEYIVDHRRTRRMFVLLRPFSQTSQN